MNWGKAFSFASALRQSCDAVQCCASARIVGPAAVTDRVRFGMRVTLQQSTGVRLVFRLVGEDEADAAQGLLSWMAPLAQSLLGKEAGDSVPYQGVEAQILSIEP